MNLKNCTTALFVKNIEDATLFYRDVLGCEIELDFGKNVIFKNGFALWEVRPDHLITKHVGLQNMHDTTINRFELYFETHDIHSLITLLKAKDVLFLHELHEEEWGQQTIRFFDSDHHLIEVGESMEQFVKRFIAMGLSLEDVSQKTHIPLKEVVRLSKI